MVAGWPLAVLRIVFGLMYLDMALQKAPWLVSGGRRYGWLDGWIQQEIAHPTFGWYAALLILPQGVFAACGAGRSLGLDAVIRRRLERAPDTGWVRLVRLAT